MNPALDRPLSGLMARLVLLAALVVVAALIPFSLRGSRAAQPAGRPAATEEEPEDRAPAALQTPESMPEAVAQGLPAPAGEGRVAVEPARSEVEEPEPPEEIREEEETPADPIQLGESTLVLYLVDGETGAPVTATAQLWRLDAPGNESWKRGDQLQAQIGVEGGEGRAHQLPEGRYRVACHAQRVDAEDPPEFRVSGDLTQIELSLQMPHPRLARLQLYTEHGQRIRTAQRKSGERRSYSSRIASVPWVQERECKLPYYSINSVIGIGGGGGGSFSGRSWRNVHDIDRGFELGEYPEDPRDQSASRTVTMRAREGTPVDCRVKGSDLGDRTYVGVSIDPDLVLRHLIVPGVGDATSIHRHVQITGETLRLEPTSPADLWLYVPIRVRIHHPDYEELKFELRLVDGEPEDRMLVRKGF